MQFEISDNGGRCIWLDECARRRICINIFSFIMPGLVGGVGVVLFLWNKDILYSFWNCCGRMTTTAEFGWGYARKRNARIILVS